MRNYAAGSIIHLHFNSSNPTDGSPITLAGSPTVQVWKDGSTTQTSVGVGSVVVDFDGLTGSHYVAIDTSADGTFYSAGSEFTVKLTAGTVAGNSVVGKECGRFAIDKAVAKVSDKTGFGLADGAITSAKFATDAISALAVSSAAAGKIATAVDVALINTGDGANLLQAVADSIAADWVAGDASPLAIVSALTSNATFIQLVSDAAAAKTVAQSIATEVGKIPRKASAIAAGAAATKTNTSITPNQTITEVIS